MLGEVNGEVKPSEIQLSTLHIWARIYDLPFKGRGNETNARMIGEKIGNYIGVDKSQSLDKSLRIRVSIDVHKPLRGGGEKEDIAVKYEKLPLFCFICGKLGHGEKECEAHRGDFSPKKNYGVWLRASPWRRVKDWQKEEGPLTCARRLFITTPQKGSNVVVDKGSEVTQTLSTVNLQGSDDVTPNNPNEGPMTSALEKVARGTSANNKSKTWKRIARIPKETVIEVSNGAGSKRNHEDPETHQEEKCEKVVYDAWKENEHINTPSRINMVLGRLSEWAKDTFGDIKKRMRQTEKGLQSLQTRTPDAPTMQMCDEMAAELNDLRNLQESYWHIRAKTNEFRDGDKNTNYFHHKASSRKRRNSIVGLLNENNEWRTEIHFEGGVWDVERVNQTIIEEERPLVLNIPLSLHWPSDQQYWWPNSNGIYTVKSGYWMGKLGNMN
ncbi:Gag-Pol polyprotein [Bienertia sinuspersici]